MSPKSHINYGTGQHPQAFPLSPVSQPLAPWPEPPIAQEPCPPDPDTPLDDGVLIYSRSHNTKDVCACSLIFSTSSTSSEARR